MDLNNDLLAGVNTEVLTDMTDVSSGGGSRGLLPAGIALVRPCMYIEFGKHVREYGGQAKPPAPMFKLGFRIVGGGGVNQDNKPEKYVQQEGQYPLITTFEMTLSTHEKAKAVKIFDAMNSVGEPAKHFVQKIAEQPLYQLPIRVKKDKKGKTVQDIDFTQLGVTVDQETYQPITNAPNIDKSDIQVLLWEQPTAAQWESIHIEGFWEAQTDDNGKVIKPRRSKNFLQERCLAALDFEGSALQTLLSTMGGASIPDLPADETPQTEAVDNTEATTTGEVAAPPLDD